MISVTLDTNCLIEYEHLDSASPALCRIIELGNEPHIQLQLSAIMAAEHQASGKDIQNFQLFQSRIKTAGLSHVKLLRPMGIIGMTYLDWMLIVGEDMIESEGKIQKILFPNISQHANEFCTVDDAPGRKRWRNAKCDVQTMWCHLHYDGDIFISRDKVFHKATKKPRLIELGAGIIATPEEAIEYLDKRS